VEEGDALLARELGVEVFLRVAAHQHHRDARVQAADAGEHLVAADVGHGEVDHHGGDFVRACREALDPLEAARGHQDGVTRALEHASDHLAHDGLVVDDEDSALAPLHVAHSHGSVGRSSHLADGEEHAEDGAAAGLARDLDGAAVPAHDAEHGRHAEAAPGELGGEEGLEDLALRVLVHPAARVAHLQEDVLASGEVLAPGICRWWSRCAP
jgi:hypothetical protein